MMKQKNQFIAIGMMLFALLFGAGNLIFPAAMGQDAGTNIWYALIGFCVTGVGLPLLGIASLGYAGCRDLQEAASRVHPWYSVFYTFISYLAIGPCFAAPRTGTVSFEIAVKPFLPEGAAEIAQPIFLAVFFLLAYWFAATPGKLVDRVGKILTPALLLTIGCLIVKSFITPMGVPQAPIEAYATPSVALIQGVLDGYNTLDAVASVIFATLVISFVREGGVTEPKEITGAVFKSGLIAVTGLALVYFFIGKLGAESVQQLGVLDTGAPVLAGSAKILFGQAGAMLLAGIVLLACLSTAIGLVTCCAAYFMNLFGRFSYKFYAALFAVVSYLIGLFGLKTIIAGTIPVLMFIYPLVVALIALLFLDRLFGGRQCVYVWTVGLTFIAAFFDLLTTAGVSLGALGGVLKTWVPLYGYGLGWTCFALTGFVIGLIWKAAVPEKKEASAA